MALTDQQIFDEIQGHLLETQNSGASWSSGHWTVSEVLAYANQRQFDFLKRTSVNLSRATLVTVPQLTRHALPVDWIITHRVVFQSSLGVFTEVPRGDGWEADHAEFTWPVDPATDDIPHLYTDGEIPTLQIETMPPVNDAGVLQLLYVALSTTLTGAGIAFAVDDEFVPAIKWGIVADMLGKVGRGQDLQRAAWAEQQYQLGVEACKVMLEGFA